MDDGIESSKKRGVRSEEEKITLSDVIACIQTDLNSPPHSISPSSSPSPSPQSPSMAGKMQNNPDKPYVRILEQPASKALRFRYQCEGRSAGSIPGANSTGEVKTYPAIQVVGYKGPAVVLVSCVTKDPPYRPHPHNLVGREGCKKGVCTLEFPQDTMSITFSNLGIQCVKKKDIGEHLDERKNYKVDPFGTGFQHKNQPTSIDLNVVRLCFQVYIPNVAKGETNYSLPLTPVVSDPIYDKKAMCDLTIVKLSDCVSTVDGGRKDIILLCEKVTKEDIEVRFYEEHDGKVIWEAKGDFQPSQVHKQTAIWFKAPRYKTLDIIEPVQVYIQLRRPSDGATSEPLPFEMLPLDSGLKRKRKIETEANLNLIRPLQEQATRQTYNIINNRPIDIKEEPIDAKPYMSPIYHGHSPTYANPSVSPGFYPPAPVAGANIPIPQPDGNYQYYQQQAQGQPLNELQPTAETQWNVPLQGSPQQARQLSPNIHAQQPTPSPPLQQQPSPQLLPPPPPQQHHQPHMSVTAIIETPMSIDSNGLNQILQLDPPLLNSSELAQYNIDPNTLSENLSNSLLISDPPNPPMTSDSLSRLAEDTYNNLFSTTQH